MVLSSIKLKKEFDLIYKRGRVSGGTFFSLRFLENRKREPSRFTIIISTKISKKAVIRNRKKRQMREIVRLNFDKMKPNYLVLLTLKEESLGASYQDLEKEFLSLAKRAGILI